MRFEEKFLQADCPKTKISLVTQKGASNKTLAVYRSLVYINNNFMNCLLNI